MKIMQKLDGMDGWQVFNGRFFSGGYSGHNVLSKKMAKSRDYIKEQINNTLESISKLRNVNFYSNDYSEVLIPLGSIVYCDIPYKKNTKQYETSKDFNYEKFYDWCREHKKMIIKFSFPNTKCHLISDVCGKKK